MKIQKHEFGQGFRAMLTTTNEEFAICVDQNQPVILVGGEEIKEQMSKAIRESKSISKTGKIIGGLVIGTSLIGPLGLIDLILLGVGSTSALVSIFNNNKVGRNYWTCVVGTDANAQLVFINKKAFNLKKDWIVVTLDSSIGRFPTKILLYTGNKCPKCDKKLGKEHLGFTACPHCGSYISRVEDYRKITIR